MKKNIAVLFAVATAAICASAGDLLINFSTPGPDKYADGTQVLEGETYSLVWTAANGEQKSVISLPIATKNGNCPPVLFVIKEENISKYDGGTWGVYLLDTRVFVTDAEGNTTAKLSAYDKEKGQPTVVNVSAAVADGIANAASMTSAGSDAGVSAGAFDLAAAEVPQPKVTGIQIVGANVVVTVKDTVPFVGYTLQSGSDAQSFSVPEGAKTANGNDAGEIKLVTPKTGDAQFFKVSTIK